MRRDKAKPVHTQSHTLILVVCICFIALSGIHCGGGEDRAYSRGSTVTVLHPGDERIFTPLRWPAQFLMFLPLVTYDENRELEGRLAKGWEHSPDYREWTFHLRSDVRWHDGMPVTAHDIKFTIELFAHPDILVLDQPVESMTVLDDSTLTLRYTQPTDALNWWFTYYPKHLLKDLEPKDFFEWEFWIRPVGNGPYRYVRHIPQTMVELEANADYYRGKPKIERVVLKFAESPLTELLGGSVDAAGVERADILKLADDPRFRIYDWIFPDVGWLYGVYWNHRDSLFHDSAVRRGLTLAIDRRELHHVLNLPTDLPIFDVIFSGRQYRRGELPDPLPYDRKLASLLLEEAGWRDVDGDQVLKKDGKEFHFTALAPQEGQLDKAAVYIQAQLREIGIRMEVKSVELSVILRRMQSRNFQAVLARVDIGGLRHRTGLFGQGSWIGYENPQVVRLVEAVNITIDPDVRDRMYRELMAIFQADVPISFLYPLVGTTVAHRRIHGLSSPWRAHPVAHMEYLWLEDED